MRLVLCTNNNDLYKFQSLCVFYYTLKVSYLWRMKIWWFMNNWFKWRNPRLEVVSCFFVPIVGSGATKEEGEGKVAEHPGVQFGAPCTGPLRRSRTWVLERPTAGDTTITRVADFGSVFCVLFAYLYSFLCHKSYYNLIVIKGRLERGSLEFFWWRRKTDHQKINKLLNQACWFKSKREREKFCKYIDFFHNKNYSFG